MILEDIILSEIKTKGPILCDSTSRYLMQVPRIVKFIEIEGRMAVARVRVGWGKDSSCLMGTECQLCKMERVLEMDGFGGCPAV